MTNNHLLKYAYIGRQTSRTNVEVIWKSHGHIEPQPWLGLENTHLPSAGFIQTLSQYTNLIQTNVDLQVVEQRTEKKISEFRMLLDAIVESTEDYIWTIGTESLEITWFNQRFYDYFLTKRGIRMHKGMRPEELFETEAYIRMWHDFYTRTLEKGSFSTEYETVKGVNILQLNFHVLKRDGKVFGISVFGKDITEQKRLEQALEENEERFKATLVTGTDTYSIVSQEGLLIEVNEQFLSLFGYTRAEVIGHTSLGLGMWVIPEARDRLIAELRQHGQVKEFEVLARRKNGETIWVLYSVKLLNTPGMHLMLGVNHDITQRKKAEEELLRLNRLTTC